MPIKVGHLVFDIYYKPLVFDIYDTQIKPSQIS